MAPPMDHQASLSVYWAVQFQTDTIVGQGALGRTGRARRLGPGDDLSIVGDATRLHRPSATGGAGTRRERADVSGANARQRSARLQDEVVNRSHDKPRQPLYNPSRRSR